MKKQYVIDVINELWWNKKSSEWYSYLRLSQVFFFFNPLFSLTLYFLLSLFFLPKNRWLWETTKMYLHFCFLREIKLMFIMPKYQVYKIDIIIYIFFLLLKFLFKLWLTKKGRHFEEWLFPWVSLNCCSCSCVLFSFVNHKMKFVSRL